MTSRRVTIREVAAEAGVSTAAVSKVLRDAYGVSADMEARVQTAIKKLGYRPNVGARTMRGRSYTIGVKATELSSLFVAEIVETLNRELADTPYDIILTAPGSDPGQQRRSVEALLDRQVDGLILIAPWLSTDWLEQVARSTPTLVIAQHGNTVGYDTVVNDDFEGARLVVEHLIGLGHQRIVHTAQESGGDPSRPLSHDARRAGYEEAMRKHGLVPDVIVTAYTEEGGFLAAEEALSRTAPPTAFFAGADIAALGVLQAIELRGLRVPDDISLVGYDNIWVTSMNRLALTTIDQSSHQTGKASARLLLERMNGSRSQPVRYSIAPQLVVRSSTAPPRM